MRNNNIASLIEVDERQIVTHSTTNQQLTRDLFAVTNLLADLSLERHSFTHMYHCVSKKSPFYLLNNSKTQSIDFNAIWHATS